MPDFSLAAGSATANASLTHMSSLLGTWTALATTYKSAKLYTPKITAHVVTHFMPEPTRRYRETCDCDEATMNQVCWDGACHDLTELTLLWSDAAVYFNWGVSIEYYNYTDTEIAPLKQVLKRDTGGWQGPYSVLLSRQQQDANLEDLAAKSSYVNRYAETWSSSLLNPVAGNNTLFDKDNADLYMGNAAVQTTMEQQIYSTVPLPPEGLDICIGSDNVNPALPLYNFTVVGESITTQVEFVMWLLLEKDDDLYEIMPQISQDMSSFSKSDLELRGPFCYNGDPKGGWALVLSQNNTNTATVHKSNLVRHECVDGYPCSPTEWVLSGNINGNYPGGHCAPVAPSANAAHTVLMYVSIITVLSLIVSICYGINSPKWNSEHENEQRIVQSGSTPTDTIIANIIDDDENTNSLTEPLLNNDENNETNAETQQVLEDLEETMDDPPPDFPTPPMDEVTRVGSV